MKKYKKGGSSSSDSSGTMRLKRDFLEGIEELEELPLGSRAVSWLPEDVESRLYDKIVNERNDWYNHPYNEFFIPECSRLKEFCQLFPRTCYFNPEVFRRVKICQHIPYKCIREAVVSIQNLDRYINVRSWNYFFERELYEYLTNGLEILGRSNILDDSIIESCDNIFMKEFPNYEMDMPLRDFFMMLNQYIIVNQNIHRLSYIFLEILELIFKKYQPLAWTQRTTIYKIEAEAKEHAKEKEKQLKIKIKEKFCGLMELFTLGNRVTNEMRVDIALYQ